MPRATCRCGQTLTFPADGPERVVCPNCQARVRVRPKLPATAIAGAGDGYLRFLCPCGRRLKVDAANPPSHGRCPDCDRVVPIPQGSISPSASALPVGNDARTADLDPEDLARLEQWTRSFHRPADPAHAPDPAADTASAPIQPALPPGPDGARIEAGLRVCPGCGKPVHMGADTCRHCGTHVPRR